MYIDVDSLTSLLKLISLDDVAEKLQFEKGLTIKFEKGLHYISQQLICFQSIDHTSPCVSCYYGNGSVLDQAHLLIRGTVQSAVESEPLFNTFRPIRVELVL